MSGVADRNGGSDIFLYDRVSGEITLVSRSAGTESATGDLESRDPSISADGRFVTFWSSATDLVAGQVEDEVRTDVFLWDRVTGTTELVSHATGSRTVTANGISAQPAISADGRSVVFTSRATDLARGIADTNLASDVFLYDRRTGAVSLVSHSSFSPRGGERALLRFRDQRGRPARGVSEHAENLVPGQVDRNLSSDVFLWDRTSNRIFLVSHSAGSPAVAGNRDNFLSPLISADGQTVAFGSRSTNLVPGQRGTGNNLFLWQRATGAATLVTHAASSPTQAAGDSSNLGALSADGSWLLYSATGRRLVPGQRDHPSQPTLDVFLWSRQTGQSRLLSGRGGSAFHTGNESSFAGGLSADGSWAVFASRASDLLPGVTDDNFVEDVFLWSRRSGRTTLLSHTAGSPGVTARGGSSAPRISADGRFIAYTSLAPDLDAGTRDTNGTGDVILESRSGDREIVTLHAAGLASVTPQGRSAATSIDASGRWVAFLSSAPALLRGHTDTNGVADVFLHDRQTRTTALLSHAASFPRTAGNGECFDAEISADSRFVAFVCQRGDFAQLFLWSRETGETALLSHGVGSPGVVSNGPVEDVAISSDGRAVAFVSAATDLVPGQIDHEASLFDVFVWERATGMVSLLSGKAGSSVETGDGNARSVRISADGRVVVFDSTASDLAAGVNDTTGDSDVFVHDRATGATLLASRAFDAPEAVGGDLPVVAADGRFVAFTSASSRLVAGQVETLVSPDLFLYDRETGAMRLVSSPGSNLAAGGVIPGQVAIDAAGRRVAFVSTSERVILQQGDANSGGRDVFLYDREAGSPELVSRIQSAANPANITANGESGEPRLSADGRLLVFTSTATNLAGDPEALGNTNVFLYEEGANTLVSHSFLSPSRRSNGPASNPVLAASGSAVAFTSQASDLVPRDFNFQEDAFVAGLTRRRHQTKRLAHPLKYKAIEPLSIDEVRPRGAYASSFEQSAVDHRFFSDRNRAPAGAGEIEILSNIPPRLAPDTANEASRPAALSADGRFVVFLSDANDLVTGVTDLNQGDDVFLHDRVNWRNGSGLPERRANARHGRRTWRKTPRSARTAASSSSRAGRAISSPARWTTGKAGRTSFSGTG